MAAVTRKSGAGRRRTAKSRMDGDGLSQPDGEDLSPEQALDYISTMLEEIRVIAHNKDMTFLSYLIGIALEEARGEQLKTGERLNRS